MRFAEEIYRITKSFPRGKLFGLVSQMRRAVVLVPSNIAEGYGRLSKAEVLYLLYITLGLSNELDTQMLIFRQQAFVNEEDHVVADKLNDDVHKMLNFLIYKRSHTSQP